MGLKQLKYNNLIIEMLLFLQETQVALALKVSSYLTECSYERI